MKKITVVSLSWAFFSMLICSSALYAGSISGTVYGIDGGALTPLSDVEVFALNPDINYTVDSDENYDLGNCTTDENGEYIIIDIPQYYQYSSRAVLLRAATIESNNLHDTNYLSSWWSETGDYTPNSNSADGVVVETDSDILGIDFTLESGGSVSGTVYGIDGGGLGLTPISSVNVRPYEVADGKFHWLEVNGFSGENGQYIVHALPEGNFILIADPSVTNDSFGTNYVISYYTIAGDYIPDRSSADPVWVTGKEDTPMIDFTLESGGWVSGTVYGTYGGDLTPLSGVRVSAWDVCGGNELGAEKTDQNGKYTIEALHQGYVVLRAFGSDTHGYYTGYYTIADHYTYSCSSADAVWITTGKETSDIDFWMPPQGTVPNDPIDDGGGGGGGCFINNLF